MGILLEEMPVVAFLSVPWYVLCGMLWVLGSLCVSGFVLVPAWWPLVVFGLPAPGMWAFVSLVCPFDVMLVWV